MMQLAALPGNTSSTATTVTGSSTTAAAVTSSKADDSDEFVPEGDEEAEDLEFDEGNDDMDISEYSGVERFLWRRRM